MHNPKLPNMRSVLLLTVRVKPTDPLRLSLPTHRYTGVYHTSAA